MLLLLFLGAFFAISADSAGVGAAIVEAPGLGASSTVRGDRWPVEYDIIISGSSMPGSGPTSEMSSQGPRCRRMQRNMKTWCALERTNDWRALTRKDEANKLSSLTGSENQRDWTANDGSRRGRSSMTDNLLWYLQMDLMVFQASHELQESTFLASVLASNSCLAKRARSPMSSLIESDCLPSMGIWMCSWM